MVLNPFKKMTLRMSLGILTLAVTLVAFSLPVWAAEGADQRSFSSPQQAVASLLEALKAENDSELLAILGSNADDLVYSGDDVADRNGRERFVRAYAEKNRIEQKSPDRAILIVGGKDYPFPIPIVREGNVWLFDTSAGREEILTRRIGRNELHTIEVMHEYVDAQREYACRKSNREGEFAQRFASTPGKKDGLYWPADEGAEESPFGPLIAQATDEGYTGGLDEEPPEPFHGYLFKILKAQGPHADGGAFDYVVDGKMALGFAAVAYPARYGASGIMTFLVNQAGVIYEKDLGPDTDDIAARMTSFDPDDTWRKYVESTEK